MSIRIDEINLQGLGPIGSLQWKLARVNLLYGKNETGKTHLVEFLIRSLFRSYEYPGFRSLKAPGTVSLTGLGEGTVFFNPSSKRKLEDYLKERETSLPENISRLLVVRGGELSFVKDAAAGISPAVLEEYLSNSGLINAIRRGISKTVQGARLENGTIQGSAMAEVKEVRELKSRLAALDELGGQVSRQFSAGELAGLQVELNKVHASLEAGLLAKRHLAWQIHLDLEARDRSIGKIPAAALKEIGPRLAEWRTNRASLSSLQAQQQASAQRCLELPWLETAREQYEAIAGQAGSLRTPLWLMIMAGVLLLAAAGLANLGEPGWASLAILISAGAGLWYVLNLQQEVRCATQNTELQRISEAFRQKFNRPLAGLADLKVLHSEQFAAHSVAENLSAQVENLIREIGRQERALSDLMLQLTGGRLLQEEWEGTLEGMSRTYSELQQARAEIAERLAALQVDPVDYFSGEAPVFDRQLFQMLAEQARQLEIQKNAENERLTLLRARLSQETRLDINAPWEKMMEKLQEMRAETAEQVREITAKVIAGVTVNACLNDLAAEEEKHIRAGLSSTEVTGWLGQLTTRYNRIELAEGGIRVGDPLGDYGFGELSTGAQEQVLLALRMGFAARCFGGESLFLVLDDAFQHSDWTRREALVDGVLQAARRGWQVLYLTMDDHLRDLFRERAGAAFGGEFAMYEMKK